MNEVLACVVLGGLILAAIECMNTIAAWLGALRDKRIIKMAERKVQRQARLNRALDQRRRREVEIFRRHQTAEAAAKRQKRLKVLSIRLQQALEQAPQSRDFRRPASIAATCRELPVEYRRQQYKRFRAPLEEHAAVCLKNRIDRKQLTTSLADLLQHLGVARFEAEYLIDAAQRGLQRQIAPRKEPDFAAQLNLELQEHHRRVTAIKALPDNPDTIEQMLEIEHRRHSGVLVQLTAGRQAGSDNVVTL